MNDIIAKIKIFETLKSKGLFRGQDYESRFLSLVELAERKHRKDFLEWQDSLDEKERADFLTALPE
jgi:hypothetical protein